MRFGTYTLISTILMASGAVAALAANNQPNFPVIEFKNAVQLNENKSAIEVFMPTTFADKGSSCTIKVKTPPFSTPNIPAGRQLGLSTSSLGFGTSDADLVDLKTNQVVGTISCSYDRDKGLSDALRDVLGAEPLGGLKKYDIKYNPATDESLSPAHDGESSVAI